MTQTLTIHRGYEFNVLESSSPPSAEQLTDLSVMGWSLVTVLSVVESQGQAKCYLTYLSRPKKVH